MRIGVLALLVVVLVAAALSACGARSRPSATPQQVSLGEAIPPPPPIGATTTSPPTAPVSLVAGDGTALHLVSIDVRGVVEDPIALTEIELEYANPRNDTLEGRFALDLPPGARVTRFAMEIGGQWQEAELVERERGRDAYESFLHRNIDPALLERDHANRFSARVFPIPASGRKKLLISYVQTLPDPRQAYRVPLRGLPMLERMHARVLVREGGAGKAGEQSYRVVESETKHVRPASDVVVPRDEPSTAAVCVGDHAIARIAPAAGATDDDEPAPKSIAVLFDTSASQGAAYGARVERLGAALASLRRTLGPLVGLELIAFDQQAERVYSGTLGGLGEETLAELHRRRALGASSLQLALDHARGSGVDRVILVSDGVATIGARSREELRARAAELATAGVTRIDAIALGVVRDEEMLRALTTALPRAGAVVDGELAPDAIRQRLLGPVFADVPVSVARARFSWPNRLESVGPGDHALVFVEDPGCAALTIELGGALAGKTRIVPTRVGTPLVEHAVAAARVDALLHQLGKNDAEAGLRGRILELSLRHRILNDHTAFVVLETEADYARFGFDRRALADVLVVADGGAERRIRSEPTHLIASRSGPGGTSTISGVVTDSKTKHKANGALVLLQCTCLVTPLETRADARGLYRFESLPPGTYTVQVLFGQADVAKVTTLSRGAKFRANFSVDPENEFRRVVRVKATSVRQSTAVGREISMEEFRNIPVGNVTNRDFTAVVESSATASFDTAGVSLAGTTAAENRFQSDGSSAAIKSPNRRRRPLRARDRTRAPEGGIGVAPWTGPYADAMTELAAGHHGNALLSSWGWRDAVPQDVLALAALGEALELTGQREVAARVWGSLVDLFPGRPELRRWAAARLGRLDRAEVDLAVDVLRTAVEQRPDHPTGHRALGWALVRAGQFAEAFDTVELALLRPFHARYRGVHDLLKVDLGFVAATWIAHAPRQRAAILARLSGIGASLPRAGAARAVLTWETDASDMDLYVIDGEGRHLDTVAVPSLAEVDDGYGPDAIELPHAREDLRLAVHFARRGAGGYGFGTVQVVRYDGNLVDIADHPFVVMEDQGFLALGSVR